MPLVNTSEILRSAREHNTSVFSVNCADYNMIYGCIRAAEDTKTPVLVQFLPEHESLNRCISIEGFAGIVKKMASEVDAEHVRGAKAMIYSTVSESKLMTLDRNRMLALLAVSRSIKKNQYVNISAAEKTYAVVCEEYGESPRTHTQFWTYIQDIEKLGVIRTVVLNDSGGRTTMITLPGIPSKVLSEKMESLLEGRSRDGSE